MIGGKLQQIVTYLDNPEKTRVQITKMHVERFKQWVSQILVKFQPKLDAGSVSHNHGNGEPTNSMDSIQPGDAEIESRKTRVQITKMPHLP